MRAEDKERLARRQRMLARERGEPLPPQEPAPRPEKAARPRPQPGAGAPAPETQEPEAPAAPPAARLRPLSPILRRRKRRRRLALAAAALAVLLALAWVTGALAAAAAMAGDAVDSAMLYLNRGGGWPAATGIPDPARIEELAGGFVEMDAEDVAVYSAYGSCVRTIQPGYARPALAVGNTRFVMYDRAGSSLRVESRTRTLHTRSFEQNILLCAVSANGTVAVVTGAERYVAELQLLDPAGYKTVYSWKMTQQEGTPVALAFAPNNRTIAVGTVTARQGRLASAVYFSRLTGSEAPLAYTADAGSMAVHLQWLAGDRLLAVFDTYAALLDPETGGELARYDFAGRELLGVSAAGRTLALLLQTHNGSRLALLDQTLAPLAETDAGQATGLTCTDTAVYLLENNTVTCCGLDGAQRWVQEYDTRPQRVLDAAQTLLFTPGRAEVLSPPE